MHSLTSVHKSTLYLKTLIMHLLSGNLLSRHLLGPECSSPERLFTEGSRDQKEEEKPLSLLTPQNVGYIEVWGGPYRGASITLVEALPKRGLVRDICSAYMLTRLYAHRKCALGSAVQRSFWCFMILA